MTPNIQLIRSNEVHKILALGRTAVDCGIADGVIPPRISIGKRAAGFLKHELEVVIVARAAGRTDSEIKGLVNQLVLSREETLAALTKYLH
jgi:prophage regulatory protein